MSKELIVILILALVFPLSAYIYGKIVGKTLAYRAAFIPVLILGISTAGLFGAYTYLQFSVFLTSVFLIIILNIIGLILARKHVTKHISRYAEIMWQDLSKEKHIDELMPFLVEIDTKTNKLNRQEKAFLKSKQDIYDMIQEIELKISEAVKRFDNHTGIVNELTSVNNSIIKLLKENAETADAVAKTAKKSAVKIDVNNKNVQKSVNSLSKITNRIKIIDDIAFQTNILALNAAIEAAKAGAYGKEFTVVANSIQKLSVKSKKSAAEIDKISQAGIKMSERTGRISKQIVPDVKMTAKQVTKIARSTHKQYEEAVSLTRTVNELDEELRLFTASAKDINMMIKKLAMHMENSNINDFQEDDFFSDDEFADDDFSDNEFNDDSETETDKIDSISSENEETDKDENK